jgi:hypothetical protein
MRRSRCKARIRPVRQARNLTRRPIIGPEHALIRSMNLPDCKDRNERPMPMQRPIPSPLAQTRQRKPANRGKAGKR